MSKTRSDLKKAPESHKTNFIAGLIGGAVSATVCHPLDVARTRFQIQGFSKWNKGKYTGILQSMKTIAREEGFHGFFKGYSATMISIPLFHSMYFTIYYRVKDYFTKKLPSWGDVGRNSLAAGVTGVVCDVLSNPLWVARVRLQSQYLHNRYHNKYRNLFQAIYLIWKEEGVKSLYRGFVASLLGVSHVMVFFPIYEHLKKEFASKKQPNETLKPTEILVSTIVAKLAATSLTYPHVVLRTRIQENPNSLDSSVVHTARRTFRSMIADTWKNEGLKGFYAGFRIDLVRILPANALVFLVFEMAKKHFSSLPQRQLTDGIERPSQKELTRAKLSSM